MAKSAYGRRILGRGLSFLHRARPTNAGNRRRRSYSSIMSPPRSPPTLTADAKLDALADHLGRNYQHSRVANARPGRPLRYAALRFSLGSIAEYFKWLLQTWFRVLISLGAVVLQPFNLVSLLFWASASTLLLGAILLFDLLVQLPAVGSFADRVTDYLIAGPVCKTTGLRALYSNFPPELREVAFRALSTGGSSKVDGETRTDSGHRAGSSKGEERSLDLDAAKLLLVLAALVYERPRRLPPQPHSRGPSPSMSPAARLKSLDEPIQRTARFLGLRYHSLIELHQGARSAAGDSADSGQPVAGIFYTPSHPDFIVLAFKGTSPTNFAEWVVDFSYSYVDAGEWLGPGYGRAHKGFYSSLFPVPGSAPLPNGVTPYEAIRRGIVETTALLQQLNGGREVNVYVTGHSLGAALASVFYARAVGRPQDFGSVPPLGEASASARPRGAVIRDLVTWGCPIFGDPRSMGAFNYSMLSPTDVRFAGEPSYELCQADTKKVPTMRDPMPWSSPSSESNASTARLSLGARNAWRVNNHRDAVGTLLPALGDVGSFGSTLSATNQFNYTHVGQEIQPKDAPEHSLVGPGTLLVPGTPVRIISAFPGGDGSRIELDLPSYLVKAQRIWLVGRLLAHAPVLYADQLNRIRTTKGSTKLHWV
ncbi:unnamed protein product [Parajaminaea phylloscopi]